MDEKIYGKIGFRYKVNVEKPNLEILERLKKYSAANISDGMNKFYTMDYGIRQMFNAPKMIGTAITVKLRSGDNLMLHKSIELIKPGDVLVVETQQCNAYAVSGGIMARCMLELGLAGIVVDGTVRDIEECSELGMPIFARGTACGAGDKNGTGEINFPISCGNVAVMPGDFILGDKDGVVVIPKDDVFEVMNAADRKLESEKKRYEEIEKGSYIKSDTNQLMIKNGFIE